MKDIFIQTENLALREISMADVIRLEKIRLAINSNKSNRPYYDLKEANDAPRFCYDALNQQKQTPRQTIGLAMAEQKTPHDIIGFVIGELTELKENWGGEVGLGDIGYFIHPEHQGKGYVTEAIRGFMGKFYFEKLNYPYLSATVHPKNPPSIRVLESVGFKVYGEITKYGEPRLLLKVTKDEFFNHVNAAGLNKNRIASQRTNIVRGLLPLYQRGC